MKHLAIFALALAATCPVPSAQADGYSTPDPNGKHDRSVCPLCYADYTNDPVRVKTASIANDAQREAHWRADAAARLAPEQIVLKEEVDAARKAIIAASGKEKTEAHAKMKEAAALWRERRKAPRITVIPTEGADGKTLYEVHSPDGVDVFYGDRLPNTPTGGYKHRQGRVTFNPPRTKH